MASAPSTEQEAPPDPSAELSGEELDEGNKGPAGQKAKGESQVKSEEVDHPPEKDKIIDDKRQSSKENSSEIEKPVNITPDKCSTQSAESDERNKGPAGQKAKGESQVKSEEVDHAPEKDKIIDDKRQSSKENSSEIEKPVNITPDKCSTQNLLTSPVSPRECLNEEKGKDVELIGPTATKTEPAGETGIPGGGINLLVGVAIVALVAIVAQCYLQSESQPQKTDWQQVDVFLKQMKNVKAKFPNQRTELWSRSEIHLKRHLQTSQPTEPVSLILTSGVRAERTMRCLAQGVASAFSAARNASVLHIDGAGKAGQDSDQVKLDIDRKLQAAFEGDKPVAVIHRLEELPPGSTLIFYRYCDHENAAYKKTFLIFTVLLGNEEEIPAEMRLSIVEEMVDDYLQKKFLSHGHPVSFDRMDLNKYGGLWSRISHLILPVAAEDRIEHEGC